MCNVPETTYPRCSDSQLSPPTSGLIHSDHRNPGSAVSRFTVRRTEVHNTGRKLGGCVALVGRVHALGLDAGHPCAPLVRSWGHARSSPAPSPARANRRSAPEIGGAHACPSARWPVTTAEAIE